MQKLCVFDAFCNVAGIEVGGAEAFRFRERD